MAADSPAQGSHSGPLEVWPTMNLLESPPSNHDFQSQHESQWPLGCSLAAGPSFDPSVPATLALLFHLPGHLHLLLSASAPFPQKPRGLSPARLVKCHHWLRPSPSPSAPPQHGLLSPSFFFLLKYLSPYNNLLPLFVAHPSPL